MQFKGGRGWYKLLTIFPMATTYHILQLFLYCNLPEKFQCLQALDVSRIKTHELKLIYQIGYRISSRASNWYKKDIAMQLVGKHYLRLFLYSGNDIFSGTICMTNNRTNIELVANIQADGYVTIFILLSHSFPSKFN